MTSTLLQSPHTTQTQQTTTATTPTTTNIGAKSMMAWPNASERLRLPCIDGMGLRQLWKLIALDTHKSRGDSSNNIHKNNNIAKHKIGNNNNRTSRILISDEQEWHRNNNNNHSSGSVTNINKNDTNNNNNINNNNNRNSINHNVNTKIPGTNNCNRINESNYEANASPLLPQQKQDNDPLVFSKQPKGWMQLSGHPESFVPTASGIVRKRISSPDDQELRSYKLLSNETKTASIIPKFYGSIDVNDQLFIELQDLLAGFRDPCVMDIKMGCRTFLESEVNNKTLRADLYKKMVAVDRNAPTTDEHQAQAITKLRYMLFREAMSSSQTKGFRIEAMRIRGRSPQKDLKTVRSNEQIEQTIAQFIGASQHNAIEKLTSRLRYMRTTIEQSSFFARHEIVGSSVFIVYDDENVNAWLIDFAKSCELPAEVQVTHRNEWVPGNREEGLLKGLDELIASFERVSIKQNASASVGVIDSRGLGCNGSGSGNVRKCLQI